ncbi:uncharacterized protein LOC119193023, partial [Manduca sexta]|uniref:uncharacterized protein LOC119193023 n=1 Tax=Manduca sexta TaxID=7130 RepID=UPI00188E71F7
MSLSRSMRKCNSTKFNQANSQKGSPNEGDTLGNEIGRNKPCSSANKCEVTLSQDNFLTEKKFREIFRIEISALKEQNDSVVSHIKDFTEQINSFQEAIGFFNEKFDIMQRQLDEKMCLITNLRDENQTLKSTNSDLSARLNLVEQHLREANVEINGITEFKSENLITTVHQIAKTVNCPISDGDLLHVTRVARMNKDSKMTRAVIAKFRNPTVRDSILAAVVKYNKSNPKEKLNSHHLGLAGTRVPIFVAEHLTPSNKSLHAAVRIKAKEMAYKFVWVRNARIYVRKDEVSQALLI